MRPFYAVIFGLSFTFSAGSTFSYATADITLTGSSDVVSGDGPCCAGTSNLFVGLQGAPDSGSLVVNGGDDLTLYHCILLGTGGKTARGDMEVSGGSTVTASGGFDLGLLGNSDTTISEGSVVTSLGGPVPFSSSDFFGLPKCISIGSFGGSRGQVVVTDAGSALNAAECMIVGGGGRDVGAGAGEAGLLAVGTLDLMNGASARTLFLSIGLRRNSTGIMTLLNSFLNIVGTDFPSGFGAFAQIGREGDGSLLAFDSDIIIDPQSVIPSFDFGAGFNVPRQAPGKGELQLRLGSTMEVRGAFGSAGIGRRGGSAEVTIQEGRALLIDDDSTGAVFVSPEPGSSAKINVDGAGSLLDAGSLLSLGVDFDGLTPGGSCAVTVGEGATVRAVTILLGPDCTIKGRGTVEGNIVLVSNPKPKISKKILTVP